MVSFVFIFKNFCLALTVFECLWVGFTYWSSCRHLHQETFAFNNNFYLFNLVVRTLNKLRNVTAWNHHILLVIQQVTSQRIRNDAEMSNVYIPQKYKQTRIHLHFKTYIHKINVKNNTTISNSINTIRGCSFISGRRLALVYT